MKANQPSSTNQLKAMFGLAKYALIASLKNRGNLFFTLVFPIAFIAIFGFLGNQNSTITIGVTPEVSHSNAMYQAVANLAKQSDSPIVLQEGSKSDLENQLGQSKIDAVLEPATDSARAQTALSLATSNGDPQGKAAAESILNGIAGQLNLGASHITNPPFAVEAGPEVSGRTYRYIDFLLPGQIGFSLLSLATFGVAFSFITLRRTLVFKRLLATTVTPLTFVFSQCLSRAVQAIVQASIIIAVGVLGFHFYLPHGWITLANMLLLCIFGIFAFLGVGIFISNIAKDEQSAPAAINLFNLPQMLLSGTFFPNDGFPHWLKLVSDNLPLSYFNTAMRDIATDGDTIAGVWKYLVGLAVWSIVAYFLAARTFKAE